jgi:hypothetical protein
MQALVRALAAGRYEDAERCIQRNPDDPWDAERFELAMRRFRAQRGRLVVEPRTRKREHTLLRQIDRRVWLVRQVLVDEGLRCDWAVYGRLDLRVDAEPAGPLVRVHDVGP